MCVKDRRGKPGGVVARFLLAGLAVVLAVPWAPAPCLAEGQTNPYIPSPPHDVTQCACHTIVPPPAPGIVPPGGGNPFIPRDELLTAVCMSCHKSRCAHPVDVSVAPGGTTLPIGRMGEAAGKVICTTCHDIHGGKTAPFLRALGERSTRASWGSCDGCHAAGKYMIHGKPVKGFGQECLACHEVPNARAKVSMKGGFERICLLCHPNPPMSCLIAVDPPVSDVVSRQIGNVVLPLDRGKLTCGSCHRAMDVPDGRKLLRQEYPAFRVKILSKDIHRSGIICAPCHGVEIRKGESKPALIDKDPEKACRVCHDNRLARVDIHPSGIVPQTFENISMPRGFPLHEGKLVCSTCHVVCRVAKRDAEGAFLRGGPYPNRENACFECHNYKGYMGFDPHRQVDASGKVNDKSCLYCHSSLPDRKLKGISKEGFVGELKTYCIGCHKSNSMTFHPTNIRHFGARPSQGMRGRIKAFEQEHDVIFPLGPEEEVLCFSCHNPHQDGVLVGEAAVKSIYSRLRKSDKETYVVCNACHGGGGLK